VNIKNYSSTVPVERTIMRIEIALIEGGAVGIHKDYDENHELTAISFNAPAREGRIVSVKLPANVDEVESVLVSRLKRQPKESTLARIRDQAAKTAWKLVQDWVEIQMAMVKMNQAEFLEIFLPYVWDGERTFFSLLKNDGFRLLEAHKSDKK